jgi:hypothetical protein
MGRKLSAVTVGVLLTVGLVAAPPAQADARNDNMYVSTIRGVAPELKRVGKKSLVKTGKATCRYLRAGGSVLGSLEMAMDAGLPRNTSIALVAGAVVFYCPEQEDNL